MVPAPTDGQQALQQPEGEIPWRRRFKGLVVSHLQQVPCLLQGFKALPCYKYFKKSRYRQLGDEEEEDDDSAEDESQSLNSSFGRHMTRIAVVVFVITAIKTSQNSKGRDPLTYQSEQEIQEQEFQRNVSIALYLAVLEILACGASASTAAALYSRRRLARKHPTENEAERNRYIEVKLQKAGTDTAPTYGLGFRPSSDAAEVLIVEHIRPDSAMDKWNKSSRLRTTPTDTAQPNAPHFVGNSDETEEQGAEDGSSAVTPDTGSTEARQAQGVEQDLEGGQDTPEVRTQRYPKVFPGCSLVAVNDVFADVGMMQLQLLQPSVTLWFRKDIEIAPVFLTNPDYQEYQEQQQQQMQGGRPGNDGRPNPDTIGRVQVVAIAPGILSIVTTPLPEPKCACVALEDEEQQTLTRWAVCSLIFGWVTLLPILFMQPHEERPRQHQFRQFLLKPSLLVLPIWIIMWILDCIQLMIGWQIIRPLYYFAICHMVLPGILVWHMFQMQKADEQIVLEQRQARKTEMANNQTAGPVTPFVCEDPAPILLKELVTSNPITLVWLGAWVSIPLIISSLLTPLKTARGRMAQGYINLIYLPMVFFQAAVLMVVYQVRFIDLPKMYLASFGLLLSLPCFLVWCFCLVCAAQYGRADLTLARKQRIERAREACGEPLAPGGQIVDCHESQMREYDMNFSA